MNINKGVMVQKPPKARKASQSLQAQQQAPEQGSPSSREDFDYEIPHTVPTESLLNTIIKYHMDKQKD